jgi:S-disulfanyl-L-cysteine oxidoreductase SoxD
MFSSHKANGDWDRCQAVVVANRVAARGLGAAVILTAFLAPVMAQSNAPSGSKFQGIGRDATAKEVAAWDIDVRADFKGLPAGSGSVAKGQAVWEAKCASCHGVFGESNQVFSPLVGGTTADDVKTGRVASLQNNSFPGRTTLMKVATLSTLWDYINRAMPWTQPKSLAPDEVYAVTAFLLNLGDVVADDFVLSDKNMAATQARMPNRNGMSTKHAMWPGAEFSGTLVPDVNAIACMSNCVAALKVVSDIPPHARNAHGNLAEQNRLVGAQRGIDTRLAEDNAGKAGDGAAAVASAAAVVLPAPAATSVLPAAPKAAVAVAPKEQAPAVNSKAALALAQKYICTACHGATQKIVGPAFADIAKKYPNQANYLVEKILKGGSGVWGPIPMPAQTLANAEARVLAEWLAAGAPR